MTAADLAPVTERRRFTLFPSRRRLAVLEQRYAALLAEQAALRKEIGQHFTTLAALITGTPVPGAHVPAECPLATVTDLCAWRAS